MIVRRGLDALAELAPPRPLLVASARWDSLDLRHAARWSEIPSHRIEVPPAVDGIAVVGGGSAIDTAKAASATTGLPLVSVPTTYAGAEWTPFFGVRDPERRARGGGGGANLHAIVYEPRLTLDLPRAVTGGTAMNALAHCAEALYVRGHNAEADEHALAGARVIARELPRVLERLDDLDARTRLLEGACHAGAALAGAGLALGHALAQVVGGRYGLPHGTLNGICLPAALRFNAEVAAAAIVRFGEAIGGEPAARVEELAGLSGPTRLREVDVAREDLPELARIAADRPGTRANPRPAGAAELEELLASIW